jgi:preprotein translocase subunit SecB
MDDELFELFKKRNVPVNINPYARELIQNAMTRVGLPPFTLPVLRIKK